MKRGCFIKTIIIVTILIASGLYIIENKFDEFFLEPGKKFIAELAEKGINDNLNKIVDSPEKDSLSIMMKSYISEFKEMKSFKFSSEEGEKFIDLLESSSEDSILTSNELREISKIMEKIKNEGLQKN